MSGTTPMMAQYLEIKAAHPGALLFYRMGDFYEMFFEDAVAAAEALDIALTKRGKHNDADIPMCGVPVHSAEGYLLTLIRKGFRVAVCEQMESPAEAKRRGSKSVVKRDVVRLVTPGTLTEDTLLEARRHNFLATYCEIRGEAALAWADISTGAFHVMALDQIHLGPELARLAPAELIVTDAGAEAVSEITEDLGVPITRVHGTEFDSTSGEARLCEVFKVSSLDGFGAFRRVDCAAMGGMLRYLDLTQKGKVPLLQPPALVQRAGSVQIDAATRRSLELTHSLSGGRAGSLLSVIDRTITPGGARLLELRLSAPTCDVKIIEERLKMIDYWIEHAQTAAAIRDSLKKMPDVARALSRLSLDRGGPRDLAAVRNALEQAQEIARLDRPASNTGMTEAAFDGLVGVDDVLTVLQDALVAEPPLLARDGGFIAPGFDGELDEVCQLRDEGRSVIAGMQQTFADQTGITSLKIKHNNVLGYFVETTATHADKMLSLPLSETFIHRQTTANQVRFTTVELSELETRIVNAGARAIEIEKGHFETLRNLILKYSNKISVLAGCIAQIDLSLGLADMAISANWCRPQVDTSRAFDIHNGRHPVVEAALRAQSGAGFVANSCDLSASDGAAIWLLTGPNMAGKSTFLRQNALIALLAQMGSYVPADAAHIGVVSQLFSRVGASDDLARGRSTFMVEMVETAAILNQADDRALVILDEIGRGTATYDGLSIAWATLEHLHEANQCRALFATHYHELTALSGKLDGVENATVSVKEWEGEVIFLHEVRRGAADRSYGVQVAQLAGLPPSVVARARDVLEALEKGERESGASRSTLIDDLPLFAARAPEPVRPAPQTNPVLETLEHVQPDALSPREALELIYKLKEQA